MSRNVRFIRRGGKKSFAKFVSPTNNTPRTYNSTLRPSFPYTIVSALHKRSSRWKYVIVDLTRALWNKCLKKQITYLRRNFAAINVFRKPVGYTIDGLYALKRQITYSSSANKRLTNKRAYEFEKEAVRRHWKRLSYFRHPARRSNNVIS